MIDDSNLALETSWITRASFFEGGCEVEVLGMFCCGV